MAEKRSVAIDFEFNGVTEELVNLVSCVTHDMKTKKTTKFWLHKNHEAQARLAKHLKQYQIIIGYACVAEARSFLSLNLCPLQFDWIDLFLEYRMLTNHNDRLQWGQQLVDGKVKTFSKPKPKWERDDSEAGFKATHSLAEATFKLTGKIRDTKEKDDVRQLIISAPKKFSAEDRERILKYNADDVEFLPTIWDRIKEEFIEFVGGKENADMQQYFVEAMTRGRYSAHTAIMESIGYPINVEATRNFSKQIPSILAECQRDINSQYDDFLKAQGVDNTVKLVTERVSGIPQFEKPFRFVPKTATYAWNQKATRQWLQANVDTSYWLRTDKGQISLSLEAWERYFSFKHDYPRGNFGAQMVRFLKLKQSLYGFSETGGGRKSFWNSVGSDGRVRPYMNIYGAQSGRSQPAASGFMFLKPAWMRALVQPRPGYFMAGVDFGQQEFFLSGLESEDQNMIDAYLSGDPYLFGAKLAGVIPQEGTREQYSSERELFKNTYLGILFGMTKYGLSVKLTNDTGRPYSEDDAQDQIDLFEDNFQDYMAWRKDLLESYQEGNGIYIPCGWRLGPDNDNPRSVLNAPIQGLGASIMRKAVDIAVGYGCRVVFTLHDAIYIEAKVGQENHIHLLMKAMREAFQFYYKGTKYFETAGAIKLDPFAWGPEFQKDSKLKLKTGETAPCSNLYLDKRAINDFNRFSKYFEEPDSDLL